MAFECGHCVLRVTHLDYILNSPEMVFSPQSSDFYMKSCPEAERIIRGHVEKRFNDNKGFAAGLIRLHFHDCFVRGCDGSVLIDSTRNNLAEKDSAANNPSLRGLEIIDDAKADLEKVCPQIVSCADVVAFAARDSVELTGGFHYDVPAGRRDGRVSQRNETVSLPSPFFNLSQLLLSFAVKGFSPEEMVTLSGAHTLGRSHCTIILQRLYNFSSTHSQDPSLDPVYAGVLKKLCPINSDPSMVLPMDPSPSLMDTSYYSNLARQRGLFTSDEALMSDPTIARRVTGNAKNVSDWKMKFSMAMVKMGLVGVLTGSDGEIRINCRKVN